MTLAFEELDDVLADDPTRLERALGARWREAGLELPGEGAPEELAESARGLLHHLSDAVRMERVGLLRDYVAWAKGFLGRRDAGPDLLDRRLAAAMAVVAEVGSAPASETAVAHLDTVRGDLEGLAVEVRTGPDENPLGDLPLRYLDALMEADRRRAHRLVEEALDDGVEIRDIYLHVFQAAQREMGRRWQLNQVSVAQEHFCTAATQLIMSDLYDRVFAAERCGRTVVVTSVAGDLHELGARMVADFFEMEGWDTVYLGANAPADAVAEALRERRADGLAVSATMTPHVKAAAELVARVRQDRESSSRWILVGGYPFSLDPELWREVGADGMAGDAPSAVTEALRLSGEDARGGDGRTAS